MNLRGLLVGGVMLACGGFDLLLDVQSQGHHSVVIVPGFRTFQSCKAAGMQAQARWQHLGESVDFVCASKAR